MSTLEGAYQSKLYASPSSTTPYPTNFKSTKDSPRESFPISSTPLSSLKSYSTPCRGCSVVELRLTGQTSISWYVRTTRSESLAAYQSNDSGLSVRLRILLLATNHHLNEKHPLSRMFRCRRSKLISFKSQTLSFFAQKNKENSLNHCVSKIEACEFLWIPSKYLRRINEKNQFIERIVGLSIKTN